MRKRKPATASKPARNPKLAVKAQRSTQAIVRSPKVRLRSVATGSADSSSERPKPLAITGAPLVIENAVPAPQDDLAQKMADNLNKELDSSSAVANVRVYQIKLLEMAQVNMTFALELSQRLATIRSPFEFFTVITEFTSSRIAMFGKYTEELAELTFKRQA
jgi:hypothetical protein